MDVQKEEVLAGCKAVLAIIFMTFFNVFFPIFSIAVIAIWPIPVVVIAVKYGMKKAGMIIVIAAIINGFLFGPLMGLITVIGFGFIGFIIGGCLNEGLSPARTLIATIIAVIVSQVMVIVISHYIFDFNLLNVIEQIITQLTEGGELEKIKDIIQAQIEIIKSIFPALIVLASILTGIVNYYLSLWYLNNIGIKKEMFLSIKFWQFPRWYLSLGILISLLLKENIFFANLNIILLFLVFLQGFAVGLFYIDKAGRAIFLRWLYIFMVFFIPPVPVILAFIGLVDLWFNLRKLG